MGAPGAGKGTGRENRRTLRNTRDLHGDIFRANVRQQTELGSRSPRSWPPATTSPMSSPNGSWLIGSTSRTPRMGSCSMASPHHAPGGRTGRLPHRARPTAGRGAGGRQTGRPDRAIAQARGDRGPRGRHRGDDPVPHGGLPAQRSRCSTTTTRPACWSGWTAWAPSTRCASGSSPPSTPLSTAGRRGNDDRP